MMTAFEGQSPTVDPEVNPLGEVAIVKGRPSRATQGRP